MSPINRIIRKASRLPLYVDILIFHCDNDADEKKVLMKLHKNAPRLFRTTAALTAAVNIKLIDILLTTVCYNKQQKTLFSARLSER